MLLCFVELDSFTSDNYVQQFDQWQPLPPKQQSRHLSAVVWTTATPCCTACQTAFCGRFNPFRMPPHVWWQELDNATISRQYKVACLVHQLLAEQTPAYIADDIQLVTDSDRRQLRSAAARTCLDAQQLQRSAPYVEQFTATPATRHELCAFQAPTENIFLRELVNNGTLWLLFLCLRNTLTYLLTYLLMTCHVLYYKS